MSSTGLCSVRAVLSPDLAAGFSLAGVRVDPANADSAKELIRSAAESRGCGILIVEEELFQTLGERERETLMGKTVPLVVLLPGKLRWEEGAKAAGDDYVAALIRRAVGYQLSITM